MVIERIVNNNNQKTWESKEMTYRNFIYHFREACAVVDTILGATLFLFGLSLLALQQFTTTAQGHTLFFSLGGLPVWSTFFTGVGLSLLVLVGWHERPSVWVTLIIKHTANFCYSLITLSLALSASPNTTTYVILAVLSYFSSLYDHRSEERGDNN